jgi:hypothetical protein
MPGPRKPPHLKQGVKRPAPKPPALKAPNKDNLKPCPPGHKRVNGKCVQKGVGKEYKP